MQLIPILLVGVIVGAIAVLVPSKGRGSIGTNLLLGIGGSSLAAAIGHGRGWYTLGHTPALVASVAGAAILIALYRLVSRR